MRLYVVPNRKGGAITGKYITGNGGCKKGCGKLEGVKGKGVQSVDVGSGMSDKLDDLRKVLSETSLKLDGSKSVSKKKKIRL